MFEVDLDPGMQLLCEELVTENATVMQCMQLLTSEFVDRGMTVTAADGGELTARLRDALVAPVLIPFATECFRQMLLYGFVAWRYRRVSRDPDDAVQRAPAVLPGVWMRLRVRVARDGTASYTALDARDGRDVPNVYVAGEHNWQRRHITSKASHCVSTHLFATRARVSADRADRRNANAHMLLVADHSHTTTPFGFRRTHGAAGEGLFGDIGETPGDQYLRQVEDLPDAISAIQDARVSRMNAQGSHVDSSYTRSSMDEAGGREDDARPMCTPLPAGMTPAALSFANPTMDIHASSIEARQDICVAFGVPVELLIQQHAVRHDDTENQRRLQRSARVYDVELQEILAEVLAHMLAPIDTARGALGHAPRGPYRAEIHVRLPPTSELVMLYNDGLIPWPVVTKALSTAYGFDEALYTGPPPVPAAMRAALGNGNGNGNGGGNSSGKAKSKSNKE